MGGIQSCYSHHHHPPDPPAPPPPQSHANHPACATLDSRMQKEFSHIGDNYTSLEQVTTALRNAGLESSNLIVGVDFTKSNEWSGYRSFNGKSLHTIGDTPNPYEQAISIIGRTLSPFDDDKLIPCFGFGDVTTHDQHVFSFFPDKRPCDGFEEALARYRQIAPHIKLAGPTSFAPIIETAIDIVALSGCQYHVLLIIADGQVTRSVDTASGTMSAQERTTIDAIVAASEHPLSIVLVGVGDGPWDTMRQFDDNIPTRTFDNFQFVNFTEILSKSRSREQNEASFALAALMEIPIQYKATVSLHLLNKRTQRIPRSHPLPTPVQESSSSVSSPLGYIPREGDTPSAQSEDGQNCPICFSNPKDMAFNCGHQTCQACGSHLRTCPICRTPIVSRLRLYS